MLDSLKGLAGTGKAQKQVDDLQSLITAAKEERSALSAMLTQISMRSSKLSQMGKSLEQIEQKAVAATEKLDEVTRRLAGRRGSRHVVQRGREARPGAHRHGHAGAAGRREADGARRRAAGASPAGPAAVLAGARNAGERRRDQEGARRARGVPQPAAAGADRDQVSRSTTPLRCAASSIRCAAPRVSSARTTRSCARRCARRRKIRRPRPRRSRTSRRSSGR